MYFLANTTRICFASILYFQLKWFCCCYIIILFYKQLAKQSGESNESITDHIMGRKILLHKIVDNGQSLFVSVFLICG